MKPKNILFAPFNLKSLKFSFFNFQEGWSVLVHGADGMDATLLVTSLAQVILNPDCRTIRG